MVPRLNSQGGSNHNTDQSAPYNTQHLSFKLRMYGLYGFKGRGRVGGGGVVKQNKKTRPPQLDFQYFEVEFLLSGVIL